MVVYNHIFLVKNNEHKNWMDWQFNFLFCCPVLTILPKYWYMVARPHQICSLVCARSFENCINEKGFQFCFMWSKQNMMGPHFTLLLWNAMEYNAAYERLVWCSFSPQNRVLDKINFLSYSFIHDMLWEILLWSSWCIDQQPLEGLLYEYKNYNKYNRAEIIIKVEDQVN